VCVTYNEATGEFNLLNWRPDTLHPSCSSDGEHSSFFVGVKNDGDKSRLQVSRFEAKPSFSFRKVYTPHARDSFLLKRVIDVSAIKSESDEVLVAADRTNKPGCSALLLVDLMTGKEVCKLETNH